MPHFGFAVVLFKFKDYQPDNPFQIERFVNELLFKGNQNLLSEIDLIFKYAI